MNGSYINSTQDGWKVPPTSTASFTNVGLSLQGSLTSSFKTFVTLVENFKTIPSHSPKLLNLNKKNPSEKLFFW